MQHEWQVSNEVVTEVINRNHKGRTSNRYAWTRADVTAMILEAYDLGYRAAANKFAPGVAVLEQAK